MAKNIRFRGNVVRGEVRQGEKSRKRERAAGRPKTTLSWWKLFASFC